METFGAIASLRPRYPSRPRSLLCFEGQGAVAGQAGFLPDLVESLSGELGQFVAAKRIETGAARAD